ncbi:MAG: hypothetical protein KA885_04000, partial [Spirochaetes bacterium]|nr:hypothetical protein [Spirochaetota bacterium]
IKTDDGRTILLNSDGSYIINEPKSYTGDISNLKRLKELRSRTKANISKISLIGRYGDYKSLILHTDNNDITVRRATLFFIDDTELEIGDNYEVTLDKNNIIVPINKKGSTYLKKITLYWTAKEEISKITNLRIYGEL